MSGITDREKGFLLAAAVILLSTAYFVLRIQPQTTDIKTLAEEVTGLEKTVNSTALPRNAGDPEAVQKQLTEANAHLKQAQDAFEGVLKNRVDERTNQALEGLMLEILKLAAAKGVTIDTSGVYVGSIGDFGIATKEELTRLQVDGQPFRLRPLRSLSLRGDYPHIQNFIKELPKLGHEVSVLRFSITSPLSLSKTADGHQSQVQKNAVQSQGIRVELVLAL